MYEGHLHIRTLQNKLTPSLGSLTGIMKEEIDLALQDVMLDCQGKLLSGG